MLLVPILILAFLFSLLGGFRIVAIPDPVIQALFGLTIFCAAAFLKKRISWR